MLKIGHRGAAGHEPENTLRSFTKAIELGADSVEFDVRKSKDGILMVMHDVSIDRTTNGSGLVKEKTCAELQKLDAGLGERVLSVLEALRFLKGKARIVIELKEPDTVLELGKILDVTGPWNLGEISFLAFDEPGIEGSESSWQDLAELKRKYPQLCVIPLFTPYKLMQPEWNFEKVLRIAAAMKADAIAPYYKMITKEMVDQAHSFSENQLLIFTWAVDEPTDIERLRQWGIDGIASNFPDRLN